MNIQEIRQQYPQYSDMSDEQLGKALHSKFYSDMSYEDFASKTGVKAPQGFASLVTKKATDIGPITAERVASTAAEYAPQAGSIIGGGLGAAFPVPGIAPWIGSALGTIAGTSIGTSLKQLTSQAQGKAKTASVEDVLREQGSNIVEQTAYDLLGSSIGGTVSKLLTPGPAREGAEMAEKALREKGGTLSASQAIESPSFGLAESFARAGAGGKGQFIALDKRNADALQAIKDELIGSISKAPPNDRVAGKVFQDAIGKGETAHRVAATALYKQFDDRAGDVLVDALPVSQFGRDLAKDYTRIGGVGKSEAGGRLIDQLSKIPNTLTFSDAHLLRSNLLATIRDLKTSGTEARALYTATNALKHVDGAMEEAAKGLPQDLMKEYRTISSFYRQGKEAFNNDLMIDLMKAQPERVGEQLFRAGNVSEIIQAKSSLRQATRFDKSVDGTEAWNKLQAGYLNGLLTSKAAVNIEGETTAQNLMKTLADAKTSRQFQVMFNDTEREQIANFGRTAYLTLRNKPSQFGVLAPILQAGAIADLALGGVGSPLSTQSPGKDVAVLASPYILAKVLTNPKAVSVLIQGMKLPAGTAATAPIMVKLIADMTNAMKEQK